MASSNPFGKPAQAGNPFGKPANPFGQAEEENPFGLEEEEDEGELGYIPKMSSRIRAGWEEAAGGTLTSTARGIRKPQTYLERVRSEVEETKFRPQEGILPNIAEAGRAAAEAVMLPWDVTFGAAGSEAVQGAVEALPGETREAAIEGMETIGLDMFKRGEKRREEAGEFDIDRPEGFEVGQGLKYYGTQMVESLGANMAPAMAMGFVTRGRVKALNNITAKHGVKPVDLDAAAQIGGLGTMGATVYGAEYERSYQENGFDHEAATQDATVAMFAEVIPEIIPFGFAMKAAGPALAKAVTTMGGWKGVAKQIVGGTLMEGGSEVLTEIINEAYEVWGKDTEFEYEEFKTQMIDAFMVGALMGGTMNIPAAVGAYKQKGNEADVPGIKKGTRDNRPPPAAPPADHFDPDATIGGIDLSTMEPLHVEQQLEPMDLNQPIEYVEGQDGQRLDPLDLDQPIPDQGIPVPETGIPNPFGQPEVAAEPEIDDIDVITEPEVDDIDVIKTPDVTGKTFDELQTDDEFIAWKDEQQAESKAKLLEMRYESPEQLKAQKEWRKENKTAEKPLGWNVNPAKDNLLTEIAKNGGLRTDEWVAQHDIDVSGQREKGGPNWLAGAANPLFSKYKKAMRPDALAEFLNQKNPKSWNIDDKYLDENGMLTATTVGELVQDMLADPDSVGGAEYTAAKEYEAEIERTSDALEEQWRDKQAKDVLRKQFEDGDPEIMAEMEDPGRPDDFYEEAWDVEARTLADWMGEAVEIGVTEEEIETATAGKPITEQVRALHELIEAKDDAIIEEQLKATFEPASVETGVEEGRGREEGEAVSEEADQPEVTLTDEVSEEQKLADAKRAKDEEREGKPDKETVEAGEGEGELFVKDTQETEDLFPGTTLPGETVAETDLKPEAEKIDTADPTGLVGEGFGDLPQSIAALETVKERMAAIYPLEMKKRLENAKLETKRDKLKIGGKPRAAIQDEIDGNKKMLKAMLEYLNKYAPEGSLEGRLPPGIREISEENIEDRLQAISEILPLQKKQLAGMNEQITSGQTYPILLKKALQYTGFIDAMEQYQSENTKPEKEKADEVREQEDRGRLQQEQDEERKRAAESGEQPPVRPGDQTEGQVAEDGEGDAVPPVASDELGVPAIQKRLDQTIAVVTEIRAKRDLQAGAKRLAKGELTKAISWLEKASTILQVKHAPLMEVVDEMIHAIEAEDLAAKTTAELEAEAAKIDAAKEEKKAAKKAEAEKPKTSKLENTGADLRRHWDKLKADLEAAKSDGKKAWGAVNGKTGRAKVFNPKPGEGATPGVQRYYDDMQGEMYTFMQVLENAWGLESSRGYYGSPIGDQVAEKIDSSSYEWATAATLADLAREYVTMMTRVSAALSGAKTVEEAELLVAKIVDTNNLHRWSDPNYVDETMHLNIPSRENASSEKGRKLGPFTGHGINKLLRNRKKDAAAFKTRTVDWNRETNKWNKEDTDQPLQVADRLWYLSEHQTDAEEEGKRKRAKSPHNRTRIVSVDRTVEKVVRKGNATPNQAKKEFGFADVGFGSWVLKGKDQSHLNAGFDAFADLADQLGLPHEAMGFFGELHFTIGALGHGKHAAHFQRAQPHPDGGSVPVINLTNTKGDGAIAHEWAHALDITGAKGDAQYVIDLIKRELAATRNIANLEAKIRSAIRPGGPYMTRSGKRGSLENVQALADWHINRRGQLTEYQKESNKLGKDYWGSDVEMFARAFEAYIYDSLEGENNYLVNGWVADSVVGPKNGYKGYLYPQAEERAHFAQLFDAMLASMSVFKGEDATYLTMNREKFDAKLPEDVKNYQSKAQEIYDRIPEMMEEYQKEAEAAKQKKIDESHAHEAAKWAKAKEEAAATERLRLDAIAEAEKDRAEEEAAGNIAESVPDDQPLNEEQLEALFDEALENVQSEMQAEDETTPPLQESAEQEEAEKPKKWQRDTVFPGAEEVAKSEAAVTKPDPTAEKLIAAAKEEGVTGINEALTALSKLFPPNKLQSFPPTIEKEAYDKAKPHFEASLDAFQKSGKALVDLFGFLIKQLGAGIRPYLVHWAKEEGLSNNLSSTKVTPTPGFAVDSLNAFIEDRFEDIHNNLQLKAVLASFYARPATEAEIKTGQEAYELVMNRKAQAIVQENLGNRQATFDKLLQLYENQPNLTSRSSTSISQQAYSTPMPLAYLASELSGIDKGTTVYEPTAGNGALLIGANPANTVVNELNPDRAANLRTNGWAVNMFDATAWGPSSNYDAAIMNPPFGKLDKMVKVDGYTISKIDHHIVTKALENLSDTGRATLIIGANKDAGKTDQMTKIFLNWLYAHYNVIDHFEAAGDLYRKQGAQWPVAVITINGRKKSDSVFDADVQRYSKWSEINDHVSTVLGSEGFTGRATGSPLAAGQRTEDVDRTPEKAGVSVDKAGERSKRESGERATTGGASVSDRAGAGVVPEHADRPGRSDTDGVGQRPSGEQLPAAGRAGARGEGAATGAVQDGNTARPIDKSERELENGSDFQIPYQPGSKGLNEAVLIPVNMRTALESAMGKLRKEVGDLDAYVMKKLGYKTIEEMHSSVTDSSGFMALQVDSIAAMIYNIESKNRGTVIADQTGVGKGRQAAAMIRYALLNDRVPVFVTAKANLFTDMYDDLLDINETSAKPFIFNADGGFIVDREGGPNLFKTPVSKRKGMLQGLANGEMPAGSNMLMLTYDQVNSNSPKRLQRPAIDGLAKMKKKPMYIFDESHNIAGDREKYNSKQKEMLPTTAGWFFNLIQDQPVMYLSATYAKRADNMPIYYRTDIVDAVDDIDALEDAINAGGEALQAVVANMLAMSGQLWRRERSFEGITFATTTFGYDMDGNVQPEKDAERKQHEQISDAATAGLRKIVGVDNVVSEWLEENGKGIVDELLQDTGGEMKNPGAMMESLMGHSPFTSRVHNFTKQLLLSLKADWIVEEAIAQHKAGNKPVIGLDNTMESFLKAEIERGNAAMDEAWTGDYRSILRAALATTRRVTLTNKKGDTERVTVPLNLLPMSLQDLYAQTEKVIDKLPLKDVTLFYIDYIRSKLEAAGIRTGEITGRKLMVDYDDGMKVKNRPESNKKFRRTTIDKFNAGEVDALILNAAGSTGLSIHASENFKDQRPRHMMIAQAMPDINILMQMFGRVNRTGQVEIPSYAMLGLDLPSEHRPLAMTALKMRSLNAQTSANTESETSLNVASILNKYGDRVVKTLLLDQTDLQSLTGYSVDEKTDEAGMAMKFTGKLALAPIQTQREVWVTIQEMYSEYIEWLDATNQNDLKTDIVDLQAKIVDNKTIYEGKDPTTIFGGNTVLHKITANVQGRAPSAYEMTVAVEEGMGGKAPGELTRALLEEISEDSQIARLDEETQAAYDKARAFHAEGKESDGRDAMEERNKLRDQAYKEGDAQREMKRGVNTYTIGSAWKLDLGDDLVTGVVVGVEHSHKKGKGSPFSPSKLKIKFMVNSEVRQVTIPYSKILKGDVIERNLYVRNPSALNNLFDSKSGTSARETRYIATGNLLGGYNSLEGGGRVISFTAANGGIYSGILMPKKFGKKGEWEGKDAEAVIMRDPVETAAYLRGTRHDYDLKRLGVFNLPNQEVRIKPSDWGSGFQVSVLRKRSQAGDRIKFDKKLHEAMEQEFVGRTQVLTVTIRDEQLDAVVSRISELTTLYIPGSGLNSLQQITGRERAEAAISFDGSMENDESLRETFEDADEGGLFDNSDGADKPKFNLQNGIDYNVQPGPKAEGKVTFFSKKLEAAMAKMMGKPVAEGTFEEVDAPAGQQAVIKVIEKVFGRRVVFFQKSGKFPFNFNGVMIPRDPKTLYVNINSKNPFAGVTGHELTHAIRITHPEVYKKLAAIAMRRLQVDGFDRFREQHKEDLTEDKMFEEMVSNVVGEALLDEHFVNSLLREGDGFFKKVMNAILDTLKAFQKKAQSRGMGSSQYFNDLEAMIRDVQQTLRVYKPSMPANFNPDSHEQDAAVFSQPKFNEQEESEDGTEIADPESTLAGFMERAGMGNRHVPLAVRIKQAIDLAGKEGRRYLADQIKFGGFDKFHGIKVAYRDNLDPDTHHESSWAGYIAARLSTGAASVMRGMLLYGTPKYEGGVIEKIEGSDGLLTVFEPVRNQMESFLGWMIARRADRLWEEGKENNFTRAQIDEGLKLNEGQEELFEQVADDFAEFKGAILDLAENAGLIDPVQRLVWDKADWIPFYRMQNDGAKVTFGGGNGFSGQRSGIRKLIGGKEKMSDPLGNIIQNFNHLITASMKNIALQKTIDDLADTELVHKRGYAFKNARIPKDEVRKMLLDEGIDEATIDLLDEETGGEVFDGVASMWQLAEPTGDVVRLMRNGKPEFYDITEPMLLKSLTNLDIEKAKWLAPFRQAKTLLTMMITAEPGFMMRNFLRDTLHAWAINEDHFIPLVDGVRGMKKTLTETGGMVDMMFAGGSFQGGYINGTDPDAARKSIRAAMREKGYSNQYIEAHMDTVVDFTAGIWDKYRRVGDAFENANREAVYEAAINAGKSKAQAIFEAKDIMDFSMHGSWELLQVMSDMLPFFNARLQGLYKLGRAVGTKEAMKRVAMKGMMIAMFSWALLALNEGDDDYEALEEWDKDTYWHFFPGTEYHIRVPKPFEIGVLFGTIPERMYRFASGQDTGGKFMSRMGHAFRDTLSMDYMPQLVKPAAEIWANESRFTERPIETMGDERKLKKDRYSSSTSETAVAMRDQLSMIGLSPKQAEHLFRGYLGKLGAYSLMVADMVVRDIQGQPPVPAMTIRELPVLGGFVRGSGPAYNTRYGTELYEMHHEVSEIWASVKGYEKLGNRDEYREAIEENRTALKTRKGLSKWASKRAKYRKYMDAVYRDKNLSASEKREKIDKLLIRRNKLDAKAFKYYSPHFDRK